MIKNLSQSIKNIIFDLGNVLIDLDENETIKGFGKEISAFYKNSMNSNLNIKTLT